MLGDLGLGSTWHFREQAPEGVGRQRSPCRSESRRRPEPHWREERPGSQEVGDSRENMAVSCSPSLSQVCTGEPDVTGQRCQWR